MEDLVAALVGVLAAVLSVLGAAAVRFLSAFVSARVAEIEAGTRATIQAQLGAAAGRVAGEIAGIVRADPTLQAATHRMIEVGASQLRDRFTATVAKVGVTEATLGHMVAGELGRLGVGIERGAE